MADWKNRVWPVFSQLLVILMGLVLVYLTVNFARQVHLSLQRQREVESLEDQIGATLAEHAALEQVLQAAQSEAAVEKWARTQGWVKPDQVLVVPVGGPSTPAVEDPAASQPRRTPGSPQQAWWSRFLGNR